MSLVADRPAGSEGAGGPEEGAEGGRPALRAAEPDQPAAGRVIEPDLLWVESVTERLLGPQMAQEASRPEPPAAATHRPGPAAGDPVATATPAAESLAAQLPGPGPRPGAGARPGAARGGRHAAAAGPDQLDALAVEAVRLALRSTDPGVARVLMGLAGGYVQTRAQLARLEQWLTVVLDEASPTTPWVDLLRELLATLVPPEG